MQLGNGLLKGLWDSILVTSFKVNSSSGLVEGRQEKFFLQVGLETKKTEPLQSPEAQQGLC